MPARARIGWQLRERIPATIATGQPATINRRRARGWTRSHSGLRGLEQMRVFLPHHALGIGDLVLR